MELEGVRGIAALAVVLWHFLYAFYPALTIGKISLAHTSYEKYIYGTPFAVIFSGTFAVAIFFILSGFVLSIGYFKTGRGSIVQKLAMSRYLRLMLPACASVLIAFFLMSIGLSHVPEAIGHFTGSQSWLSSWSFDTSLLHAIKNGVIDIFMYVGPTAAASPFNNVLWTMHTEFFGSFVVFAFLMFFAKYRLRWMLYVVMGIAALNTWFLPFILGMTLADLYAHGYLDKLRRWWIVLGLLLIGIFLGSFPNGRVVGTMYEPMKHIGLARLTGINNFNYEILYLTLGALMVVGGVLLSTRLASWLARPRIAALGKYTFALYLTHLLVLYTVACSLVLALHGTVGYNKSVAIAVVVSIPFVWSVTYLFERYIDAPAIKFSKYLAEVFRGERREPWRDALSWFSANWRAWSKKYIGLGIREKESVNETE